MRRIDALGSLRFPDGLAADMAMKGLLDNGMKRSWRIMCGYASFVRIGHAMFTLIAEVG
jgi:hypothetical protein